MIKKANKNSLAPSFYQGTNVLSIAKNLLGKYLYTHTNDLWTGGIIVETEAYCGATDKACHAYPNKRTKRTETMYQTGGIAYVYLCYGIHSMFNVVTNQAGKADAILIRAIEPTTGINHMLKRRNMKKIARRITGGPGCVSKALGIELNMDKQNLSGPIFWITNVCIETDKPSQKITNKRRIESPRVGVEYAEESAKLPWRFRIKDNKWTSPAK